MVRLFTIFLKKWPQMRTMYKVYYKLVQEEKSGQLEFDFNTSKDDHIGPMFLFADDSEDAANYLYNNSKSALEIKVGGKWQGDWYNGWY